MVTYYDLTTNFQKNDLQFTKKKKITKSSVNQVIACY